MARNGGCGSNKEIAKEALQDTLVMGVSFHLDEYLLLFNLARDPNSPMDASAAPIGWKI
jgi:hypothetical protein